MDPIVLDGYDGGGPGAAAGLQTEDLNITVVAWPEHYGVDAHVNDQVDVVSVVLSGVGVATIDGTDHPLSLGTILVIPKGATRSIRSMSVDFRYVNVHKRKRALMPRID
jgi:mannose-6-phosphate isomerase-like protein (cupin superfamily)